MDGKQGKLCRMKKDGLRWADAYDANIFKRTCLVQHFEKETWESFICTIRRAGIRRSQKEEL